MEFEVGHDLAQAFKRPHSIAIIGVPFVSKLRKLKTIQGQDVHAVHCHDQSLVPC